MTGTWGELVDAPTPAAYPGEAPETALAITTLTRAAKDVIEGAFSPLWVRGEITDFKAARSGHWYFSLRDAESRIRCVMWRSDVQRAPTRPTDGMLVTAFGQMTVYPAGGEMQLRVTRLGAEGDGLWRKALEETLARLRAEGLLDEERKRPLPRLPRVVAVVTSPDGAALQDIRAVAARRFPAVQLVLVPAKVQGEGTADELVQAMERIDRWGGADVVIIGRGGGAREDLWAFNDERVARAVAACRVPVIAAVGHEVDITVVDLVADLRAPTPSAAAEAAVPDRDALLGEVRSLHGRLTSATTRAVQRRRQLVSGVGGRFAAGARGLAALEQARLRAFGQAMATHARRALLRRHAAVDALRPAVTAFAVADLAPRHAALATLAGRLDALSPLATLGRGYAVARSLDGRAMASVDDFHPGTAFDVLLADGAVRATATARRSGAPLDAVTGLREENTNDV
ncbi:MAG: exodeoxyribonuclease VII large subunit [Gemmatimonadaceae bacterium]|nr:exodeoxyribonuclease VII large subunit [Gemmatimonadaceae bacterium]